MKKLTGWTIVLLFIALYAVSDSGWMKSIAWKRYKINSLLASDKYRYGDLYGFSYLEEHKIPVTMDVTSDKKDSAVGCAPKRDINLYSICDSYLYNFIKDEKAFCRVNGYFPIRTIDEGRMNVVFDKSKWNILLIECTERNIRTDLSDTLFWGNRLQSVGDPSGSVGDRQTIVPDRHKGIFAFSLNKGINPNLEFNLFDYRLFNPIKEFKAWFNQRVFNRVDEEVSVSADGSRLYLRTTVDTTDRALSSFATLTNEEMDLFVSNLNQVAAKYKRMGFDYVYFCGIPSPATVYKSGHLKYNDFLPRLQNDSHLKVNVIDIYNLFRSDPANLYERSDTHWNTTGFRTWQKAFNSVLDTIPAGR